MQQGLASGEGRALAVGVGGETPGRAVRRTWAAARPRGAGQVLVLFVLFLLVLLGISALAVDYASWLLTDRNLQNVADHAALAGASEFQDNSTAERLRRTEVRGGQVAGLGVAQQRAGPRPVRAGHHRARRRGLATDRPGERDVRRAARDVPGPHLGRDAAARTTRRTRPSGAPTRSITAWSSSGSTGRCGRSSAARSGSSRTRGTAGPPPACSPRTSRCRSSAGSRSIPRAAGRARPRWSSTAAGASGSCVAASQATRPSRSRSKAATGVDARERRHVRSRRGLRVVHVELSGRAGRSRRDRRCRPAREPGDGEQQERVLHPAAGRAAPSTHRP